MRATLVASAFSVFAFATLLPPHYNPVAMPTPVAAATAIRLSPNCHELPRIVTNCHELPRIATRCHPIATPLPRNCHAILTQLPQQLPLQSPALLPAAILLPALLLPRLPSNCQPIATQLSPNCHELPRIATRLPPSCHALLTQFSPNYPHCQPCCQPAAHCQPACERQHVEGSLVQHAGMAATRASCHPALRTPTS